MRMPPRLPRNPLLEEWERPKTLPEWDRYYRRETPLRELLTVFMDYLIYFAAADLCYIDAGLLDRPDPEVILSLEYIVEHLVDDAQVLATLYMHRESTRDREHRWDTEHRAVMAWRVIRKGAA